MTDRRSFLLSTFGTLAMPSLAQAQYYVPTRPDVAFIFIGASWCAYCKRAAPVLKQLGENSDIPIMVVSTDNKPIAPFTEFRFDPEHPMVAGNGRVPRTALFNADMDQITGVIEGFRGTANYARNLQRLVQLAMRGEVVDG